MPLQHTAEALTRRQRLSEELDRIRQALAAQHTVMQVRVFGSFATGQVHAWSDLDLFVIMRSEEPFLERGARLAKLIKPGAGVQFLVYTPAEAAACLHRPFFREEILKKGMVMPLQPQEDAQRWLRFGWEDLRMAELALQDGLFNQTCFHAQQCTEKCFKAILAHAGELLPRTHALVDLWERLPDEARAHLGALYDGVQQMDQFYIPTRYPDALPGTLPEGLPQRSHAEVAMNTARTCYAETEAWCKGSPFRT